MILEYAVLRHISFHQWEDIAISTLLAEIFADIPHGKQRVDADAEFLPDLHNGGFAGDLADLAAVDRNKHIRHLDIGAGSQDGHGFTDGRTGGDNVLDRKSVV